MLMKQKILLIFCTFVLVLTQAGCGREENIYLEKTECRAQEPEAGAKPDEGEACPETERSEINEKEKKCYVYVCGAVKAPGVYPLPEGSRVYEAVELAGGLTKDAKEAAVNQAELVSDGQMIRIPAAEEETPGAADTGESRQPESDGRLDLNMAAASELMELPGIGQSKADGIIEYREKHGGFQSPEDLMNVDGIKEGVYNRIKERIKVK